MGRMLLACILGCAIFALVAWQFDLLGMEKAKQTSTDQARITKPTLQLGDSLYTPAKLMAPLGSLAPRRVDPVVVLGSMTVIDRPEIASQVPGTILFIGEEIPEGALQAAGAAAFVAEPFDFALINHGSYESITPFRRLYEGQIVHQNQMLALIDPSKALGEVEMKHAKVIAAQADSRGAEAIAREAQLKFETQDQISRRGAGAAEDLRGADLTRVKMGFDSIGKQEFLRQAKTEEEMSRIVYKQHVIHNMNPGTYSTIQKIFKQRGEAVREVLEPIIQVYSLERLKAEAQIEDQFSRRLVDGMRVILEPSLVDSPPKTYRGHTSAVNCLAVTNDAIEPLIVSGSEDWTVLVWKRYVQGYERKFDHPEAVKALATSPVGSSANLLLTGCAYGSIRLFDLSAKDDKPLKVFEEHGVAITALAFSPDGKYFASGAADGAVAIWSTASFTRLFDFDESHGVTDPHHGAITALHFTPQCKLVTASADKTLRVWSLQEKGATLDYAPLTGRSGSVGVLDVSTDGRFLLFDQGKTMQMKEVSDGRLINTYQSPGGVVPFETLALFSPDASLMLTAGASEGRLQLWHLPQPEARGFEVRHFAPRERNAPVTCAAFAPRTDYNGEGSFAVSANKDGQIYLWPLPSHAEVANHQIRNVPLRMPSAGLNSTRQLAIEVEVPNPPSAQYPKGRLEPGRPVTIVIE